jgi:hypothetical protein
VTKSLRNRLAKLEQEVRHTLQPVAPMLPVMVRGKEELEQLKAAGFFAFTAKATTVTLDVDEPPAQSIDVPFLFKHLVLVNPKGARP